MFPRRRHFRAGVQPGQPCAAQRTVTSPPAWPAARRPRGSRRRGQEWPHARGGRAVTPSPSGRPCGDRVADASPPHVCVRDGVMEANATATRVAHDGRASTCDVYAAPTLLGGSVQQSARTRMQTRTHMQTRAHMQTCTHADMHTCRRAHAGVRTRRHVHTQMCTHMQTCTHADMCTRTHTCTRRRGDPRDPCGPWRPPRAQHCPHSQQTLNLVPGLDSEEDLELLCHHASCLGDRWGCCGLCPCVRRLRG